MNTTFKPGTLVISRMGLVHQVASTDNLERWITLRDGRTFEAFELCLYVPALHGTIADLETCADCDINEERL